MTTQIGQKSDKLIMAQQAYRRNKPVMYYTVAIKSYFTEC